MPTRFRSRAETSLWHPHQIVTRPPTVLRPHPAEARERSVPRRRVGGYNTPVPLCRDEERPMPRRSPRLWFVGPVALTSLCLFALSIVTALVLYHQQGSITEELSENVKSRRAASDLAESLHSLIGYLRKGNLDVAPLHDRIEDHLTAIRSYDDKAEEKRQ